jgi:hypothetical protein
MSLWEWLLSIVWHGLDVFVHLWQIDREMREGKWDDDASDSSRACKQRRRRARRLTRRRGTR